MWRRFRDNLNTYTWNEINDKDNSFEFKDLNCFVPENKIQEVLDSIENNVNIIKNKLKAIKGLSEIDEIYDIVKDLSEKLY